MKSLSFFLPLLLSTFGFAAYTVLLKAYGDNKSYLALAGAVACLVLANFQYAALLKINFTSGYMLSAICCLCATIAAGALVYGESLTWPRLMAGGCFLAGIGFLTLATSTEVQ